MGTSQHLRVTSCEGKEFTAHTAPSVPADIQGRDRAALLRPFALMRLLVLASGGSDRGARPGVCLANPDLGRFECSVQGPSFHSASTVPGRREPAAVKSRVMEYKKHSSVLPCVLPEVTGCAHRVMHLQESAVSCPHAETKAPFPV